MITNRVQGNASNIVFLKSTDDDMLKTLETMSGVTHKVRADSKTVTSDMSNITELNRNEGKMSYNIATKEDVIVVFSLGGANKTVNETLLKARQKGTHIVAITSLTHHPLAKLSDQLIQIYDAPKARKKIRSRLMLNLAGTLLFETLLKRQAAQQEQA